MIKIITIDDEPDFTEMVRNFFEPRGYTVFIAANGEDGLKVCGAEKPDIAFVDLRMPGIRGEEVLVRMKDVSPETICIVITASTGAGSTRERIIKLGAYECFDKPLASLKDLEVKMKEALAAKK